MFRFANDKLLPNDCLNILCVMKFRGSEVTTSGTSKPTRTSLTNTLEDAADDGEEGGEEGDKQGFLDLLHTGDLADVDVVVGSRTFHCHKAILGAKSPFFKAAFVHNMKEKATGKITIDSAIEAGTVNDMLTHIYGGKIENMEEKCGKLLAASDQYDLKHLKRHCEELLCRTLNITNCLDLLILADLHSTDILKPHVIRFVVENSREIVTQENWKEKLMTFPDVFADVFSELASQPQKKKSKPDEEWKTGVGRKAPSTAPSIDSLYFRS